MRWSSRYPYARVTPYLIVGGASAAIDFYTSALGATERMRMPMKGGVSAEASVASAKASSERVD